MSSLSVGDIFAGKPETKQERRGPSNIAYPEKSPVKPGHSRQKETILLLGLR